ncbi:MAG: VWA domain-containing protein [Deltaproteobacteria bacterium]|nr:VWA domain-containing protein [Deltaproteobacteria bacterium]
MPHSPRPRIADSSVPSIKPPKPSHSPASHSPAASPPAVIPAAAVALAAAALAAAAIAPPALLTAAALALILSLAAPARARALTWRWDPIGDHYRVKELEFTCTVTGQKAEAVLTTGFQNLTGRELEIDYLAPLPQGASVVSALLVESGTELKGRVYERGEAFRLYSEIVAELRDPALVEYAGRDTFRARIFPVPPRGKATLKLRLSFLVPRERGVCGLALPLAGPVTRGRPIPFQRVELKIKDTPGLSSVYSPLEGISIERSPEAPDAARALFTAEGSPALGCFRVFYRTGQEGLGATVLSHKPEGEDGYFLFLAEPPLGGGAKRPPKDVCFALDVSGSMLGHKLRQAEEALRFIMGRLGPEDRFNLVVFGSEAMAWRESLALMTEGNRADCERFLEENREGGSTFMEGALRIALGCMDPARPGYILFLTDGQANVGVSSEGGLAGIAREGNAAGARIFSFGVGYDVNARLLERFSSVSGGTTVYVDEREDIEEKVSAFFSRITSPVLARPELASSLRLNGLCPRRLPDLFYGGQIALAGRYHEGGKAEFTLKGSEDGGERVFRYSFDLAEGPAPDASFLATLWANRRSAMILEELDLQDFRGKAGESRLKELVDELVGLARSHGVLTPYTSFLAAEDQDLNRADENYREAMDRIGLLSRTTGRGAVLGRRMSGQRLQSTSIPGYGLQHPCLAESSSTGHASPPPFGHGDFCLMDAYDLHGVGGRPAPGGSSGAGRKARATADPWVAGGYLDGDGDDIALSAYSPGAGGGRSLPETIGGRTFFRKSGVLVQGDLTEGEFASARKVEQFSEEYFRLASEMPPDVLGFLSQERPTVFRWKGEVYRIEPLKAQEAGAAGGSGGSKASGGAGASGGARASGGAKGSKGSKASRGSKASGGASGPVDGLGDDLPV